MHTCNQEVVLYPLFILKENREKQFSSPSRTFYMVKVVLWITMLLKRCYPSCINHDQHERYLTCILMSYISEDYYFLLTFRVGNFIGFPMC